jgi:maltose-binding protein MalE
MQRREFLTLTGASALALLAAACGGGAAPTATTAPKPAAEPTKPAAAATTAPAAATAKPGAEATKPAAAEATKPAAGTTPAAAVKGTFTLWHGWTGAEEETLRTAVADFQKASPDAKVNLLAVPFDQLKNKFTTESSTGGGPEALIGPKDWIGELAQAKLIAALDDLAKDTLATLSPTAVDAVKFGGKVYAVPESVEAVALWYNADKVKTPPADLDALLKAAPEAGVAINSGFYHSMGFISAFGGNLFDSQQKCILDQGGTVDALAWLKTAKGTQGVTMDKDGAKLDALMKDGKVGMVFNGPWATGDYAKALGRENLAVAAPIKVPKTGKTFAPFLGTKNLFLSANAKGDNQKAALAFMAYMVSPAVQALFATKAGHIYVAKEAKVDDKIIQGFVAQSLSVTYFPNEPEMGAVWTPADDMIAKVIEGKAEPEAAVKAATETINKANKKM